MKRLLIALSLCASSLTFAQTATQLPATPAPEPPKLTPEQMDSIIKQLDQIEGGVARQEGPEQALFAEARALGPIQERQVFGRSLFLFDGADRARLAALGEVRTPSIADLFVAVIGGPGSPAQGAAA